MCLRKRKNNENKQEDKLNKDSVYLQHTKKYTDLLDVFVNSSRSSNRLKHWLKLFFFIIIVLIMISLILLFAYSVDRTFKIIKDLDIDNNKSVESIVGSVVSIIPSFATMLVSLIRLPKIIAEYLFNPKEDENMTKIIGQIQNYDLQMYPMEQRSQSLRKEQQDVNLNDFDGVLQSLLSNNEEKPKSEDINTNDNGSHEPDNDAG